MRYRCWRVCTSLLVPYVGFGAERELLGARRVKELDKLSIVVFKEENSAYVVPTLTSSGGLRWKLIIL